MTSAARCAAVVKEVESSLRRDVTGIIHASGVVRDKRIENKTSDDFDAVYGTKIGGLLNLLQGVNIGRLQHLVLFSSLAGFHGNVGQSDYAMANDALNKIAHAFGSMHPSCRARSLCFGPWDGGMVTPTLKAHFKAQGVEIIPRDSGGDITGALIAGSANVQNLVGNWLSPPVRNANRVNTISRTLKAEKNPFLRSHLIHGKAVLPMTVACGYIGTAAMNLCVQS